MLELFNQKTYPKSTSSLSEALAKILAKLQDLGVDLKDIEAPLLGNQLGLYLSANHILLSGKMLKELSPQTLAKTFGQLSKPSPTLGVIDLSGNCLIQSGFYPKIERESTLSDILETEVEDKYFLSEKSIKRISMYKDNKETPIQSKGTMQDLQTDRTLLNVNSINKRK